MGTTRLWFIRHGEVEAGYVGTFVGSSDVQLSDLGRHQAEAIAVFLEQAGVEVIATSPLERARRTSAPLVQRLGIEPIVDKRFAEMDFGEWEGLAWNDIAARDEAFAHMWQQDPERHACPGGESAGTFATRVQEALSDLLAQHKGKQIALFAHAGVNRAVLADVMARPYMEAFAFAQDYGCVNAAGWDHDIDFAQVALVNFVPGPRSTDQGDGKNRG